MIIVTTDGSRVPTDSAAVKKLSKASSLKCSLKKKKKSYEFQRLLLKKLIFPKANFNRPCILSLRLFRAYKTVTASVTMRHPVK